ncbi:SsgA family sporulation/cell division regulator [Streptomyces sp. NPDC054863]
MTHSGSPRTPARQTSSGSCRSLINLQAVVCPGLSVSFPALLSYHSADPYAVHLDNHIDLEDPVRWTFARELLATGLTQWAGIGDVSVHPGKSEGGDVVLIALRSGEETVLLRAPTAIVRTFLARTERIVRPGTEHAHMDLDTVLGRLLGGPAEPGEQEEWPW